MYITAMLTSIAMIAFAANSLLARLALSGDSIDASSYTIIRLVSGAIFLALLAWRPNGKRARPLPGNWMAACALFAYAFAFSLAYLLLGAAMGALILFASVQATMLVWGMIRGDRPTATELAGLVIAFGAFVYLLLPGIGKPDPLGSVLMIVSGIAWGVYTLRGRGSRNPLGETAGNFMRSAVFCIPLIAVSMAWGHMTVNGAGLAAASGMAASGLGYSVWYRALPGLDTVKAAIVQLSVPVIAAAGAIVFLSEALTLRFIIASVLTLGGIGLAIFAKSRKQPA